MADRAQQIESMSYQLERAQELLDAARQAGNRIAAVKAQLTVTGLKMQIDALRREASK